MITLAFSLLILSVLIYLWARISLVHYLQDNWPDAYKAIGSPSAVALLFVGITISDALAEKIKQEAPTLQEDLQVQKWQRLINTAQTLFVIGYSVGIIGVLMGIASETK